MGEPKCIHTEPELSLENNSTQEKIIAAAHKLFTQKGYAATKTREIAEEAGINLALLNYYFRSKEKLFDMIMADNMQQFVLGLAQITNDKATSYQEKFALLASSYTDLLLNQPEMPIFILSEIRNNPVGLFQRVRLDKIILSSNMFEQVKEAMKRGEIQQINPMHILMNLLGLTVFPFVASPMLKQFGGMNEGAYRDLMLERKKMIPLWVAALLQVKAP
ncbi:TetR/AcrR family transcriptional regulator [Dyadobacter tibetensis]|uniref:TetR/AcrR family transcriptional regulator n=1 Tax=Dyadobacter tibetensis TaxID=1211851 RepID=UPI00046F4D41|nr:TetR/AcrR family transcriptional regulator [Dyadobacter tibetensis]